MPELTPAFVAQLKLKATVITEESLNIFYYGSDTNADGLDGLITRFRTIVMPKLIAVTSTQCQFESIEATMVKGGNDFTSQGFAEAGTVGGDTLPPYATWDFTLLRGGAGERNGYKRFPGVPEASQAQGIASAGAVANLNLLADALDTLLVPTTDQWSQVIRREVINHVIQNPPKWYSNGGTLYSRIGTQNSRKFGHGR